MIFPEGFNWKLQTKTDDKYKFTTMKTNQNQNKILILSRNK